MDAKIRLIYIVQNEAVYSAAVNLRGEMPESCVH